MIAWLTGILEQEFKEKFHRALEDVQKNEAGEVAVHGRTQYFWTKAL
jgi:hypothetical protein